MIKTVATTAVRKPALWWYERIVEGAAPPPVHSPERIQELRAEWEALEPEVQAIRLRLTDGNMNAQFNKLGSIMALLALVFGFLGFQAAGLGRSVAAVMCFLAAFTALWAMSPRRKIFKFHRVPDAALRMRKINSPWDEYWYTYEWLVRKQSTTNAIEVLVFISCRMSFVALASVVLSMIL
jgi:hypothetical protein